MPVDYIGFAYAATVAAGGIIGYAKAGMTLSFMINGYHYSTYKLLCPYGSYYKHNIIVLCDEHGSISRQLKTIKIMIKNI